MKHVFSSLLLGTALTAAATTTSAAGFMKYDGVDGESKSSTRPGNPHAAGQRVQQPQAKPRSLLLPAVQKARNAPQKPQPAPSNSGGNAETTWKVEKGEK